MDRYKAQAREVLDRLREAILARFDDESHPELAEVQALAEAVSDYVDAEATWHDISDEPDEDGED